MTFKRWLKANLDTLNSGIRNKKGSLYLFIDEFTDYNDVDTGIKSVLLLSRLGYGIMLAGHDLSGRTFLSKGLLRGKPDKLRPATLTLSKTWSHPKPR
jgi:Fe-S oxidoreductase